MSQGTTITVCFNNNGLADRKYTFKRFSGNNQAILCPNLVTQFDDDLHSLRWHFQTD